ncbi:protein of unknown function [Paenibacillus alvei]|uniref:Uncharacterized protein n=1 Tax=Paenibacillus alvei TaxID=44250 RepID=A0A383RC85_PAEAL|nr:protein of unknown function [Paenibacillus alvei]
MSGSACASDDDKDEGDKSEELIAEAFTIVLNISTTDIIDMSKIRARFLAKYNVISLLLDIK